MNREILFTCTDLLIKNELTIAFVESATAGRVSAEFSLIPNAGSFLKGGIICYDAKLKETLLNVSKELLDNFTPESMEVTKAITNGLEVLVSSDLYVGITGLTTPGGSESEQKPVGTMFIHCRFRSESLFSERVVFQGSPEEIILQTIQHIAFLLCSHLSDPRLSFN
ncbi:nicotinamide-nucleotide amidohydrolase family protein [Pedobacter nutrimenti]|uniref:CinA family protein n=1 Tax=Pedobacter nutrimenti TaxID=1241337 RepID=UPI0029300B8B|nr:nicotinamide-nucleotide amidohydrolase family protein [Pedobacter nutrimenti]